MSAALSGELWLVGCGNMAGAMLRRWIAVGLDPASVFVVNRHDRALPPGVRQGREFPEEGTPEIVMLGVKPQQLDEAAARFAERIDGVPILISILAGVEEAELAKRFSAGSIFRAMPNLPVELGKGVTGLHSRSRRAGDREIVEGMMRQLGLVEWIEDEALFDAITVLSGCGPAFLYRFIDALAEAGTTLGLAPDRAQQLALATVEGAGLLAASAGVSPAILADRVASPGGSTREGLNVLDRDDALKRLMAETLAASARRSAEMSAAARR